MSTGLGIPLKRLVRQVIRGDRPRRPKPGAASKHFPSPRWHEFTVVPWISERTLRTELLLNSWQYPLTRRRTMEITLVQYGPNGERLRETRLTVAPHERKLVRLDASGSATYGMCFIEPSGYGGQHIQIWDDHSFAITHGRPGRCVHLARWNRPLRLAFTPYQKRFNLLIRKHHAVEILLFNQSDETCRLHVSVAGRHGRIYLGRMPAFGALKVDPAAPPLSLGPNFTGTITFNASAPFDYYVLACVDGERGRAYSIQHVK